MYHDESTTEHYLLHRSYLSLECELEVWFVREREDLGPLCWVVLQALGDEILHIAQHNAVTRFWSVKLL
jgi:hypothetical protein